QILLFLIILVVKVQAQLYTGPAEGTSAIGVLVNTGSFIESAISNPDEKKVFNKFTYIEQPDLSQPDNKNSIERIYVEDTFGKNVLVDSTVKPLVLKGFNGIVETNSIPPDPYIAVGPNHILSQVNTSFAISDKNGNRLKTIDATGWYQSALSVAGPFDPKVIYDQYANRWVMVWLDQDNAAQRGTLLISVSDDENPLGAWYNWAVPSSVNGSTAAGNWSDYQGVGYDQNAIYITSNQFNFSGSFEYSKVRIIPKTQLYKNTGEAFKFFDLWDIRNPINSGSRVFSIRPSRSYANSSDYYMVHLPQGSGNAAYIYQINNVATAPVMTGYAVSIKTYSSISTANQLGGGSPALEAGNASLRNEPVHKDDKLHFVHSVNNPLFSGYAALHYVQVNLSTKKVIEDVIYGANKFFYIYPALAVDKNNNVALTYSRSGDEEYAGAFFTAKLANTTNFVPSVTMQAGKANYVKTFSGTRNRWGDYNGMWLDPSNEMSIWAFSEYTSATNTWGTWTTELRLEAYTGMHLVHFSNGLQFKPTELGHTGDTVAVIISNYGSQAVQLDSIGKVSKNFLLVSSKPLPLTLNAYDSLTISVIHKPIVAGLLNDSLKVYANDPAFGSLPISAKGYVIDAS
ncbi:MAG: hypothetical protein HYV28_10615, partial [Ignavibacteriales bacterium]|nr:hypothetical protein [Ignavibacteriales bacterium]